MKMILNQALVVEGKYDKIKLSEIFDGFIFVLDGYKIYKNAENIDFLKKLAVEKGIIILTDNDKTGFEIRNFLNKKIIDGTVTNAYVPDVYGKERRKKKPSAENKIGVEGMEREILISSIKTALQKEFDPSAKKLVSRGTLQTSDLYDAGLCGKEFSKILKNKLLSHLRLPGRMNSKNLLFWLNERYTNDEFLELIKEITDK